MDHIAGLELPAQFAGSGIERVEIAIAEPKNTAPRHHRARQVDVQGIRDGLGFRLHAVHALRFEAPLAGRGELPLQLSDFASSA